MNNYIGLACTCHDPAIAIVNSKGEIVFAEGAERYLQNKRGWNSMPDDIGRIEKLIDEYCEKDANLIIGLSWSDKALFQTKFLSKIMFPLLKRSIPTDEYDITLNLLSGLVSNLEHAGNNLKMRYSERYPDKKVIFKRYDHHLTHAASACFTSHFKEAVCAVIDGSGELSTTGFYHYKDGKLEHIKQIKRSFPSIGFYYSHLCHACGFDSLKGEEWKIMGLASYGKFDDEIYNKLKKLFTVKKGRLIHKGSMATMFGELRKMRRKSDEPILASADLAFTGQYYFCEIIKDILVDLYSHKLSENLVLTGGCALNSACNGKILEMTPFKDLFVFSAPGDDGNAVGAGLLAFYDDNPPNQSRARFQSPYLGSKLSIKTVNNLGKFGKFRNSLPAGKKVTQHAAELLANGKIIGWAQGRAEFGPRALGNRSILADPRTANTKDTLNARVKFREEYRPFAPAILHEFGDDYFMNYRETPYMERALMFKKEVLDKVPAVVHVDGTGRLQTVKKEWNEKYYDLVYEFYKLTGVPIILNTSFNVMGKPIIHSVEDALAVFLTSGLDALFIDDFVFEKDNFTMTV